jgi:hypothetical protein
VTPNKEENPLFFHVPSPETVKLFSGFPASAFFVFSSSTCNDAPPHRYSWGQKPPLPRELRAHAPYTALV